MNCRFCGRPVHLAADLKTLVDDEWGMTCKGRGEKPFLLPHMTSPMTRAEAEAFLEAE